MERIRRILPHAVALRRSATLDLRQLCESRIAAARNDASFRRRRFPVAPAPVRVAEHHQRRKYRLVHERAEARAGKVVVPCARDRAEALAFGFVPRADAPVRRDGGDLERVESVDVHLACVEVGNCACRANGFRTSPTHPRHRTAIGKPGKLAWRPSHNGAAVRMDALDQRRHPQRRHLLLRKARLVRAEVYERHLLFRGEGTQLVDKRAKLFANALVAHGPEPERPPERKRVAGDVELRHHRDATLGGVVHHLAELVLRVEPADIADVERFRTLKLRKHLRFEAPPVVFGEVPVEDVHLATAHRVDHALHVLHLEEVPSGVVHESAPLEVRPVFDAAARHFATGKPDQLIESNPRPTFAAGGRRGDRDSITSDFEDVRLVGGRGRRAGNGGRLHRHPAAHCDGRVSVARIHLHRHRH